MSSHRPQVDPCDVTTSATLTNETKMNTAKFNSNKTLDGAAWDERTKDYKVSIVQPNPSVTKTASPTQLPTAQSEINYTVTLSNRSGRPQMFDSVVVDCLPAPLKVIIGTPNPSTGSTRSANLTECANGGIVWTVGTLEPGTTPPPSLTYTAKADGPLAAGGLYTNTATLTGSSMSDTISGERTYTTKDDATVTAPRLAIQKESTPDLVTIGETYTSAITTELRANVDYYSAAIIDTLPTGVSPDS